MSILARPAVALALAALMFGCSDDSDDTDSNTAGTGGSTGGAPAEPAVNFTDDIHPILVAKCGSSDCHNGAQAPILPGHGAADVQDAYEATQTIGQMGQPVYERILARITSTNPNTIMPPPYANPPCQGAIGQPGCISEDELALIRAWIAAGTPLD